MAAEGRFSPGPFREKPEIVASPPSGIQRPVQVFPDHMFPRSPSWFISLGCGFHRWWSDFKHLWSSYHMTPLTQTSSLCPARPRGLQVADLWTHQEAPAGPSLPLHMGSHLLVPCPCCFRPPVASALTLHLRMHLGFCLSSGSLEF